MNVIIPRIIRLMALLKKLMGFYLVRLTGFANIYGLCYFVSPMRHGLYFQPSDFSIGF